MRVAAVSSMGCTPPGTDRTRCSLSVTEHAQGAQLPFIAGLGLAVGALHPVHYPTVENVRFCPFRCKAGSTRSVVEGPDGALVTLLPGCRPAGHAFPSVLLQCVVKTVEGQPFVAPRCIPVACAFSTEEVRCPFPANGTFIRTPKPDPKMECDDPFMEGARRRLMPPYPPPPLPPGPPRVSRTWPPWPYLCHLMIECPQPGFGQCGARLCHICPMTGCCAAEDFFLRSQCGEGQARQSGAQAGHGQEARAGVAAEGAGAAAQVPKGVLRRRPAGQLPAGGRRAAHQPVVAAAQAGGHALQPGAQAAVHLLPVLLLGGAALPPRPPVAHTTVPPHHLARRHPPAAFLLASGAAPRSSSRGAGS